MSVLTSLTGRLGTRMATATRDRPGTLHGPVQAAVDWPPGPAGTLTPSRSTTVVAS